MAKDKTIFITGGTGFLGKRLEKALLEKGNDVKIFTRNPKKPNHVSYDLSQSELIEMFNGSYAVINLAGAPIIGKRWNSVYKQELYNSRIDTTARFADLIANCETPPQIFISASAIGIYGDRKDEVLTEESQLGHGFIPDLCKDWELAADPAKKVTKVFHPRIGIILEKGFGALKQMELPYRMYVGGPLGNGRQCMSWMDIDDFVAAFEFVLENQIEGVANFTAPSPERMNDFSKKYGKVLSRPSIFRVPSLVLGILLGESAKEVTSSLKVIPRKLLSSGFAFKYGLLEESLKKIYKR